MGAESAVRRCNPGRAYLVLGLVLAALGIVGYATQLWAQRLWTPWYLPIAGTLAVVCIVISLWKARTLWRVVVLVVVGLLAGAEWTMLAALRLPEYTGPVKDAQPFPAFATVRADGKAFTQRDLAGDHNDVLVFFRGRW
jgi:hypothetical protein